jgi:hypothetical protein
MTIDWIVTENDYMYEAKLSGSNNFNLLYKNESRLIKSPACLSVCPPLISFEPTVGFSLNLVCRWCHWRWCRCYIFNLVVSAIPKWQKFKLLRWVQRNPLITFKPIGGFGWNFVWTLCHWRWLRFRIIKCRSFNYSKMVGI